MLSAVSKIITKFKFSDVNSGVMWIDLHDKQMALLIDTTATPFPVITFNQGTGFQRLNHLRIAIMPDSRLTFHAQPSPLQVSSIPTADMATKTHPVTVFLTDNTSGEVFELGTTPSLLLPEDEPACSAAAKLAEDAVRWVAYAKATLGMDQIPIIYQINHNGDRDMLKFLFHGINGSWELLRRSNKTGWIITQKIGPSQNIIAELPDKSFRISALRVAISLNFNENGIPVQGDKTFVPFLLVLIAKHPAANPWNGFTLGITMTPAHLVDLRAYLPVECRSFNRQSCVDLSGDAIEWVENLNPAEWPIEIMAQQYKEQTVICGDVKSHIMLKKKPAENTEPPLLITPRSKPILVKRVLTEV